MSYAQYADPPSYIAPSRQAYYQARPRGCYPGKFLPPELVAPQISRPRSTPLGPVPGHRRHVSEGERVERNYAWIGVDDFARQGGKFQNIHSWLEDQRPFLYPPELMRRPETSMGWARGESVNLAAQEYRRRRVDTMLGDYQARVDAAVVMAREHEAETRRRNAERVRAVADEMRKIEERIRTKREQERQKFVEERRLLEEYRRERRRTEQATLNQAITDAWDKYETGWDRIRSPDFDDALTFRSLPWLLTYVPKSPEDIHPHAIAFFLFSTLHSRDQPRKERIRGALLRWHPDRFGRVLERVQGEERDAVEEGVGIVTRCLNDLLTREQSPEP